MNNVLSMARKFRQLANLMEELFTDVPSKKRNENKETADKILKPRNKKKHWTQTPRGRRVLSERMKAYRRKMNAKQN